MATIKFFIQSKKNPAGIYIRLREGKDIDAKTKTKYLINADDWSSKKGQPKNLKDEEMKILNNNLEQLRNEVLTKYNSDYAQSTINSLWLKRIISKEVESIPNKLIEYFDYFINSKKHSAKPATLTKARVVKHLLERFEKLAITTFQVKDVNRDFVKRFEEYSVECGYSPNTIARNIRFIKTVCYHSRDNGIETHFQLDKITTKNEKVKKVFLDEQDLMLIDKIELTEEHLDNARDWLLISCETGQRVSDFLRFNKTMLRKEKNKQNKSVTLVEFTQVKTGKIMSLPLSSRVKQILEKRNGEFPDKISSQKYNVHIKKVAKRAGLTYEVEGSLINPDTKRKESGSFPKHKLVSSHIGRRSFATNNYGTIPTSLLIIATGHSTEKQFLEYIGKTTTEQAKLLAEYIN